MVEYDFTPQRVQRAYEEISLRFHDQKVKIETGARLIKDGILTTEDWNKMNKRAMEMYIEEDEAQRKRQKEQEAQRKQEMKPDSMIPKLWRSVKVQPERLRDYIATYEPAEDLVLYLGELKTRSLHYASIYHGTLSEAVQFIEFELAKRNVKLEKAKDTAKPKAYVK